MASISAASPLFTLVNVFPVHRHEQKQLCDRMAQVTEELIRHLPGFVSASFHLSHDGEHVVNYAQWQSEADFRSMHDDPRLAEYFAYCRSVSRPVQLSCDVVHSYDAGRPDGG
nr:antibiotic biosynthesis monooxygenase [Streptomyces sp. WAC 06738]